ncbi:PREDICTED: bolA-like protein 3 [Nanorana parkeri]|uniref:bolA-like protein 3 n=1 Tax=Nanorana parkeri TaxID=125878 RepID=UPI000853FC84|nr:PREDICTED: bolA-like protein 3 [Nanorana parkeri]
MAALRRLTSRVCDSFSCAYCRRVLTLISWVAGRRRIMWAAGHLMARTRTCVLCNMTRPFASRTEGEQRITQVLKTKFPRASQVRVVDISGGCGSMYEIHVESEDFKEKRTVLQHQMINEALQEEIKSMHGLRIFTSVPKQ